MIRRREWGPECSHSTMTRVYHPDLRCKICKRAPQFGWMYRCTTDREALILKAKLRGEDVTFDTLGRAFAQGMTLGKYGANLRTRRYAFLKEITASQLATYTPDQLATILTQRDHLLAVIAKERRRSEQGVLCDAGRKYPDNQRPWMPDEKQECSHTVCQFCHGVGKDKSWVSLNAILNGEIPPTVATGYAFSYSGSRPFVPADVATNLGCRPVYFPENHPVSLARRTSGYWSLEDQLGPWSSSNDQSLAGAEDSGDDKSLTDSNDGSVEDDEASSVRWTRFPDPQLDDFHSDITVLSESSMHSEPRVLVKSPSNIIRPPWTPPPTPFRVLNEAPGELVEQDGRNPSSLRTISLARTRLFSSFPSIDAILGFSSDRGCKSEDTGDVGLISPMSDTVLDQACRVPLPRPDLAEEFLFAKGKISIGDFKHTEAFKKCDSHVTVPAIIHSPNESIAMALMTEESVKDGIPDLVMSAHEGREATQQDYAASG